MARNFDSTRHLRVGDSYGGSVTPIDPRIAREFLEALVAGFSVLGGVMAYASGYAASQASARGEAPSGIAHSINEGISDGFEYGVPAALVAFMIMGWAQ